MKGRTGSYKKILLHPDQIDPHLDFLKMNLTIICNQERFSDPEIVSLYLLLFLRIRHPKNWAQKKGKLAATHPFEKKMIELIPPEFALNEGEIAKLNGMSLSHFFSDFNLRGVPAGICRTMHAWINGEVTLQLLFRIPSAYELLKLQTKKIRCLTLIKNEKMLDKLILESRDPLSFLLHDLAHADQFFYQKELIPAQLGLYALMEKTYHLDFIKMALQEDPQFKKEFEYVTSDMNGYALHIFKCFKAIFHRPSWKKRREGEAFLEVLEAFKMPLALQAAALRLNTSEFTSNDEKNLIHFFENNIGPT